MATDRTTEEQQAINYAFANGGTWAILTNFEKLRLFNAKRDWLVLSFEDPSSYLTEFDQLWQLSYENVLNGSLDTLSNQRYARDIDSTYLDFINVWRLKLAQDLATRRTQNKWVLNEDGSLKLTELKAVVQRFLDRLVIARFAEDWLVIPAGTVRQFYELRQSNRYSFSLDQQLDQFFRRFNEEHNSALFAYGLVDEADFSDDVLMPLLTKLYEVRYRAMPADILGNTYEQYLGKALALQNGSVTTRDNLETRKKQGSYYTPQVIVQYIVDNSLGRYLYGTANGKPDGDPLPDESRKTSTDIRDLRVLDSACGSGSFLIYAYRVLADFYEGESKRLEREGETKRLELAKQGMTSPLELQIQLTPYTSEIERIRDYPRLILEHHIYGVDLDPQAAEIATVNLIMRAMEGRHREKLLPLILNQNVKVGNGLVGLKADDPRLADLRPQIAKVQALRAKLVQVPHGAEHDAAMLELDATSTSLRAALDQQLKPHFSDLERVRPFHWGAEFPEVFYNADGTLKANPGFTIVIGNPPWEILKPDLREFYAQFDEKIESRYTRAQVEARIAELDAEDPHKRADFEAINAGVAATTSYLRGNGDYTRQGRGDAATHKLFMERMYSLLQSDGRLGYVVPSGIYTDLGTKELREMLLNEGSIQYIYSFSNERFFFPGVDHRFKFCMLGAHKGKQTEGFWAAFRFNPRVAVAPDDLPSFLGDQKNQFYMQLDSMKRFSPESLSVMEFQSKQDYGIAEKIYADIPLVGKILSNSWNIRFTREINNTTDMDLLNTNGIGIPLYEGKMINQYDNRYADNQYWIDTDRARERLARNQYGGISDTDFYRIANRRQARSTDIRTMIACIVPPESYCWDNLAVSVVRDSNGDKLFEYPHMLYIVGIMNSFIFDYTLRQQIGSNLSFYIINQLPVPRLTAGNPTFDAIVERAARLTCTRAEFADLWQSVMGSAWDAAKGAVDPAERQRIRDEIDALVVHLYGLNRDEYDHILGTFPLVFPDTPEGQARRAATLATYDARQS
jgi:hypothetical protein